MQQASRVSKGVRKQALGVLAVILSAILLFPASFAWADEPDGGSSLVPLAGDGIQLYDVGIQYDVDVNNQGVYSRVILSFKLSESLDLTFSEPDTELTIDFFKVSGNDLGDSLQQKNKAWAGYLNSYSGGSWTTPGDSSTKYPQGDAGNTNYTNSLPAGEEISTQTSGAPGILFGQPVSAETVIAATISVTDANGNTNWKTIYSDGREPEDVPVTIADSELGVVAEFDTGVLPAGTHMRVAPIDTGSAQYQAAAAALGDFDGFVLYDIYFYLPNASGGEEILQPNGPVIILILLDGIGDYSSLEFAALDLEGNLLLPASFRAPNFGVFETTHFSPYAFAWKPISGNVNPPSTIPATGDSLVPLGVALISVLLGAGIVAASVKMRRNSRES